MFFILRTAFWLSLVVLLIPADPETKAQSKEADISSLQAIGAAQQAYVDMTRFCERNPMTCETGGAAVEIFSAKARTGARMVYEYLGPGDNTDRTPVSASRDMASGPSDRELFTGSTAARPSNGPANGTLTPADLQPEWTVPAPLRKPV
ncbi:hypothetical protein D1F64_07520 [Breoghania sp. L-A4]|nr:hypothetical protein D1F64_07520 [Breoghania sp. L-A4]